MPSVLGPRSPGGAVEDGFVPRMRVDDALCVALTLNGTSTRSRPPSPAAGGRLVCTTRHNAIG